MLWHLYSFPSYHCDKHSYCTLNHSLIATVLWLSSSSLFRCHEWCKHGTCAMAGLNSVSSMVSYFQSALQLFVTTNMDSVFQQNGIVPSTSATYKVHKNGSICCIVFIRLIRCLTLPISSLQALPLNVQ